MSLALRALDIIGIKIFRLIQINPSPSDIILVCKSVIGNNVGSWDSYPYIKFFYLSLCLIIIVFFPSLFDKEYILLVIIPVTSRPCEYYWHVTCNLANINGVSRATLLGLLDDVTQPISQWARRFLGPSRHYFIPEMFVILQSV